MAASQPRRNGKSTQTARTTPASPKPGSLTVKSRTGHAYRKAGCLFGPEPTTVEVTSAQRALIEADPNLGCVAQDPNPADV